MYYVKGRTLSVDDGISLFVNKGRFDFATVNIISEVGDGTFIKHLLKSGLTVAQTQVLLDSLQFLYSILKNAILKSPSMI